MKNIRKRLGETHWIFVVLALLIGLCYTFITPPLWGVDETSHFSRVYQITHGDILPDLTKTNYGGKIPENLANLIGYVKQDLLDDKPTSILHKDVDSKQKYQQLESKSFAGPETTYTWTSAYSPFAYTGSIIGGFVARVAHASIGVTIYMARIGGLLFYIALVWLALYMLRDKRVRWLLFLIALSPVAIAQASVVTADNIVIGLSILFTASLIKILLSETRKVPLYVWYTLVVTAILLPLVKINYILLGVGLLLVPGKFFSNRLRNYLFKFGTLAVAAIAGLGWVKVMSAGASTAPISQRPDGLPLDQGGQIVWVIHHPLHFLFICLKSLWINGDSYFHQAFTLVQWNFVDLPSLFAITLLFVCILAAFYAKDELVVIRKHLAWFSLLAVAGVFSVFLALYVSFNPVGYGRVDGVQGRYFIPFLAPALMLIAAYIPLQVRTRGKFLSYAFPGVAAASLVISVVYYYLVTYL